MINSKTALVLGAGSSVAFGYPVGAALRQRILDLASPDYQSRAIRAGLYFPEKLLNEFVVEFGESQTYSIDKFLARRPEYAEIGKRAIATILLDCERRRSLFTGEGEYKDDLWLRYLLNQLDADTWDQVDLSKLSIITFNYDRSLEHFLLWSLMRSYGREQQEVIDKLRTMNIVHIYGTLGPVWPGDVGYFPYGHGAVSESVQVSANAIRIIPEGRSDSVELRMAQSWLRDADAIAFLGFGFDRTNLERLDALETCCEGKATPVQGVFTRKVVATTIGMTNGERFNAHAASAWGRAGSLGRAQSAQNLSGFMNCNCLSLLRETQILK